MTHPRWYDDKALLAEAERRVTVDGWTGERLARWLVARGFTVYGSGLRRKIAEWGWQRIVAEPDGAETSGDSGISRGNDTDSDTVRLWQIGERVAAQLGHEPPQTWREVERAAATQRPPAGAETILVTSDWQGAWVDMQAMHTRANVIAHLRPNVIAYGGDIFDMYAVSRFTRNPALLEVMSLKDEAAVRGTSAGGCTSSCPYCRITPA